MVIRPEPLEIDFKIAMPPWLAITLIQVGVCCFCLDDGLVTDVCAECGCDHGPILDQHESANL